VTEPFLTRALPRPAVDPAPPRRPPWGRVVLAAAVVLGAGGVGLLLGTLGVGAPGTASPPRVLAASEAPPAPPAPTPPPDAPDAAAALVEDLPPEVYRDCTPRDIDAAAGQTASVRCTPATPGADELLVTQWRDGAAMEADFASYLRYPDGKCSQRTGVRSTWDGGKLACYLNDNDHAVVMWEYDDRALQVFAIRRDAQTRALYAWWLETARRPLR
jgi:hypothetical protein